MTAEPLTQTEQDAWEAVSEAHQCQNDACRRLRATLRAIRDERRRERKRRSAGAAKAVKRDLKRARYAYQLHLDGVTTPAIAKDLELTVEQVERSIGSKGGRWWGRPKSQELAKLKTLKENRPDATDAQLAAALGVSRRWVRQLNGRLSASESSD